MYNYDTITEAINDLVRRGYCHDFNLFQNFHGLKIVETYRFEGETDPADEAVLYAIIADGIHKGIFVNAYGVYANSESESLLQLAFTDTR